MGPDFDPDASKSETRIGRRRKMRQRIVASLLELLDRGLAPRAADIAARANVSVRTLFQYFADLRDLYLVAADQAVLRIVPQLVDIDPRLPLEERIARFVDQRAALCEAIAPLCRAAARYDPGNRDVEKRLSAGRMFSRNAVGRVFGSELSRLPSADRYLAVEALLLAGDWDTWERLRNNGGMDVAGASTIVTRLVRAALEPPATATHDIARTLGAGAAP